MSGAGGGGHILVNTHCVEMRTQIEALTNCPRQNKNEANEKTGERNMGEQTRAKINSGEQRRAKENGGQDTGEEHIGRTRHIRTNENRPIILMKEAAPVGQSDDKQSSTSSSWVQSSYRLPCVLACTSCLASHGNYGNLLDGIGPDRTGPDGVGPDWTGSDVTGRDRTGLDRIGRAGRDRPGAAIGDPLRSTFG